jgi:hypothetical protein
VIIFRSSSLVLFVLLFALQLRAVSSAHTLDMNTARVTLRDDHIEVALEIDLLGLVSAISPKHPDPTALAISDEAVLTALVQRTKETLQAGSRLTVNGVVAPLLVTAFPSASEVRFLAAYASANQQAQHELVSLRLETPKPVSGAKNISVSLPKEAGQVLFTFIQPATRLAAAGERVGFSVLVPQSVPTTK